jgi:predicted metalloendopeptidase
MVIGHEITHTFDDQGAQYDKMVTCLVDKRLCAV